jgi:hypothetical protein
MLDHIILLSDDRTMQACNSANSTAVLDSGAITWIRVKKGGGKANLGIELLEHTLFNGMSQAIKKDLQPVLQIR